MKLIGKALDSVVQLLASLAPIQTYEYCNLETSCGKDENGEHYPALLTSEGGYISGIEISGVKTLMSADDHRFTLGKITEAINYALEKNYQVDYGYTQDGLGADRYVDRFFAPKIKTAGVVGLDMVEDLREAAKTMRTEVHEEWQTLYFTSPPALFRKKGDEKTSLGIGEYEELVTEHKPGQPFYGLLAQSDDARKAHLAQIETIFGKLEAAGLVVRLLSAYEIAGHIRKDITLGNDRTFTPWLWGDQSRYRVTPEDKANQGKGLINWSGPVLGMQLHPEEVQEVGGGVLKVGQMFVAPLLVEMMPENGSWSVDFLASIPKSLPLRQRVYMTPKRSGYHDLSSQLASLVAFGKGFTKINDMIVDSFDYISQLNYNDVTTPSVGMIFTTWGRNEEEARENQQTLKSALDGWGGAKVVTDRGNPSESYISSIPGFSSNPYCAMTIDKTKEFVKLIPYARPAIAMPNGTTALKTKQGTLFPLSPISDALAAFIEIIIAGSGSGKSVYQNAINRDTNFSAGNERITRHTTIDIGISGQGTVQELRRALPANRVNEALYYRMTMSKEQSINPFDLQLGQTHPSSVDSAFQQDFMALILTPQGNDAPPQMMLEMTSELLDYAYSAANDPETAKEYFPGVEKTVDAALQDIEGNQGEISWGRRKTWLKVRDALFEAGKIGEAIKAQRQVVPCLPNLPQLLAKASNIKERYERGGRTIVEDFSTLVSAALKKYPILAGPTRVDFGEARYLVIDVAKVTSSAGSTQTAIGYALAMHIGTRDFWIDYDDIDTFDARYKDYGHQLIKQVRTSDLGLTMEEYRRTQGQPAIRSMVNRYAAEGRKNRVRVQLVMQQPDHADPEIFSHATILTMMGVWQPGMIRQLEEKGIKLTDAEKHVLLNDLRGPTSEGSSFLTRYQSKKHGWCSQLLYLKKSPRELWSTVTGERDRLLKNAVELLVGDDATAMLSARYPKGTAEDAIEKEMQRRSELEDVPRTDIYEDMAKNIVEGWALQNAASIA